MNSKFIRSRLKLARRVFAPSNLPRLALVLVLLAVLYYVYVKYLKEGFDNEDAFESTPSSFETDVAGSGKKLVLFYADWCGHCKKLKPEWNKAALEVNDGNKKVMIAVDVGGKSDEQTALASKYDVDGYPTIVIFQDGKPAGKYEGARSVEGFKGALA